MKYAKIIMIDDEILMQDKSLMLKKTPGSKFRYIRLFFRNYQAFFKMVFKSSSVASFGL